MKRKSGSRQKSVMARDKSASNRSQAAQRRRLQHTILMLSLDKLSKALKSDVLSDDSISNEFDLSITNTVNLGETLTVPRANLFAAFRATLRTNKPVVLKDSTGGRTEAVATVDQRGVGSVALGTTRFLFTNAGLLVASKAKRTQFARQALRRNSLNAALSAKVIQLAAEPLSDATSFEAMSALASSPEAFFSLFREKLGKAGPDRSISRTDILPDDERYWDNLIPPPTSQTTIAGYVSEVSSPEAVRRLEADNGAAFSMLTPLFVSPASVPHPAFESIANDALISILDDQLAAEDHFALLGLIEICARRVSTDARFVEIGERALKSLFGDMMHLKRACALFAPTFLIATAFLAEHERYQSRPVYWRRLAAAAHAELIVRACGVADSDYRELMGWAVRLCGNEYMMSVYEDMAHEPNWRPDWIGSNFMVADAIGRARGALAPMGNSKPPEWQSALAVAEKWMDKKGLSPLSIFPCVLEGARRPPPTMENIDPAVVKEIASFRDNPTLGQLNRQIAFGYVFGFPSDILELVTAALEDVRRDPRCLDDREVQLACSVAAHVAARAEDQQLAKLTSDIVLEKLRGVTESSVVFEAICILLTAAGGINAAEDRAKEVGSRLEHIAFTMPLSQALAEVSVAIKALCAVHPAYATYLGKAAAAARLGAS